MSWKELHQSSEKAASVAHELAHRGHEDEARVHYFEAAVKEEQALKCVDAVEKPRTYAITAVSASSLWYKAGELVNARRLAQTLLATPGMMGFAVEELRELVRRIDANEPRVEPQPPSRHSGTALAYLRAFTWQRAMVVASGLAALVLSGPPILHLVQGDAPQPETYATQAGVTQQVTFADGSTAKLGANSELQWRVSDRERRVQLISGEALFDVAKDATRSFLVTSDVVEVRVVGTQFRVQRNVDGGCVVTVVKGTVDVRVAATAGRAEWSRTLHANQQVEYQPGRVPGEPQSVFVKAPLSVVLAELALHTDKRIVVTDPRVKELPISGVLAMENLSDVLARLPHMAPVRVEETGDAIVVSYLEGGNGQP